MQSSVSCDKPIMLHSNVVKNYFGLFLTAHIPV